jgi:2-phosphosulfolactate phosphatase
LNIVHAVGVDGARSALGIVVVIDVLRAFSVSAYALAGGARECLLVRTVDEARALAADTPGAIISAEVDTLPVAGIAISNSPTQMVEADVSGRTIVQRTSAGTQAIRAVARADATYAASLVVARATAQACLLRKPRTVTLVASGEFPEDHACARYIEGILRGEDEDVAELLAALINSERYQTFARGDWPGFPNTDLDLALATDRFDFAMPAISEERWVRLTAERA